MVVGAVLLVAALVVGATGCMNPEERSLFDRTNALRASARLPQLREDGRLDAKAQAWARRMAAAGRIWHSNLPDGLENVNWTNIGENVGVMPKNAPDPMGGIHQLFVQSPPHRANLLDPRYNSMGVGVARGPDGRVYVSEVFATIQ